MIQRKIDSEQELAELIEELVPGENIEVSKEAWEQLIKKGILIPVDDDEQEQTDDKE